MPRPLNEILEEMQGHLSTFEAFANTEQMKALIEEARSGVIWDDSATKPEPPKKPAKKKAAKKTAKSKSKK